MTPSPVTYKDLEEAEKKNYNEIQEANDLFDQNCR
jgi:hypothetical protein